MTPLSFEEGKGKRNNTPFIKRKLPERRRTGKKRPTFGSWVGLFLSALYAPIMQGFSSGYPTPTPPQEIRGILPRKIELIFIKKLLRRRTKRTVGARACNPPPPLSYMWKMGKRKTMGVMKYGQLWARKIFPKDLFFS